MAEIKSTLDLVMERTRHLSMSGEEKSRQQKEDFQKRLQGLLQQYADQVFSADELHGRIADLQSELKVSDGRLVPEALSQRIDPDHDNQRWLDLLDDIAPAVRAPLAEALAAYRQQRAEIRRAGDRRALAQLSECHGIGGSAVAPNPQRDPQFQEQLTTLRRTTNENIAKVVIA